MPSHDTIDNMLEEASEFLYKMGEKDAINNFLKALGKHSNTYMQLDIVSKCLFKGKEYLSSIEFNQKSLKLAPTIQHRYACLTNLINAANHANYPELAFQYIKEAEDINPADLDVILEKSYACFLSNRKIEAEQILQCVLRSSRKLNDDMLTKIRFNLGTYYMYRDEFLPGLYYFLIEGKKLDLWHIDTLPYPFWEGGKIGDKTLIIMAEAGIGDELINIRFCKHLSDLNIKHVWYTTRTDIYEVFKKNGYPVINTLKDIDSSTVMWTYSMSVPLYLKLGYDDLWYGLYLKSCPEYNAKHDWILNDNKLKIGLRWRGNPEYDHDLHRSVPLLEMFDQVKHIDATFYSLQRDDGVDEIGDIESLIPLHEHMETFEDTLAIINHMDYVVTSCTSIAHAAASMGKKTCVVIPISAYYTWSHSMDQSPWYGDHVKLFRQTSPRCWKEPLEQLKNYLNEELHGI